MDKTNQTVRIVPKSNLKFKERDKINTPTIQVHDRSLSYLGTETSIKSDEVKLDLILKSPLLQTHKIIHDRSLSYLGTETSIKLMG